MDAAALAANRKIGLATNAQIIAEANTSSAPTSPTGWSLPPAPQPGDCCLHDHAHHDAKVPTYFLGMIGLSEFTFPLTAKATLAMGTLEWSWRWTTRLDGRLQDFHAEDRRRQPRHHALGPRRHQHQG